MTLLMTYAFAALAVVAVVAAIGLLASPPLRRAVAPHALGAAGAVSGTATVGSLYLSEIAGYIPCELCWVQRIFMYPIAVITTVALVRRKADALSHVTALAALGLATSAWHVIVQRIPGAAGGACDPLNPCSAIYIERFGFVTIPVMAGAGFALLLALAWTAHRGTTPDTPTPTTTPRQEHVR